MVRGRERQLESSVTCLTKGKSASALKSGPVMQLYVGLHESSNLLPCLQNIGQLQKRSLLEEWKKYSYILWLFLRLNFTRSSERGTVGIPISTSLAVVIWVTAILGDRAVGERMDREGVELGERW
jgi:hypothetical protein